MGDNIDAQLALPVTGDGAVEALTEARRVRLNMVSQIACGRNFVVALSADLKQLYAWGSNLSGQVTGHAKASALSAAQ